jgi:hypothetical protein
MLASRRDFTLTVFNSQVRSLSPGLMIVDVGRKHFSATILDSETSAWGNIRGDLERSARL